MKNIMYSALLVGLATSLSMANLAHKTGDGFGVGDKTWNNITEVTDAANSGDPAAMYVLGWAYDKGENVDSDSKMSKDWYRKAAPELERRANSGDEQAMVLIGEMYQKGNGVSKSEKSAAQWYQKASDKGNAEGMYRLGKLYEDGDGVDKDKAKARELFRAAADKGQMDAEKKLND